MSAKLLTANALSSRDVSPPIRDVYQAETPVDLCAFAARPEALALCARSPQPGSQAFFARLTARPFEAEGLIRARDAASDVRACVAPALPADMRSDPFCALWFDDLAMLCRLYADLLGSDSAGLRLSTERGCNRYHRDNVPFRLLVTYHGQGTEWLPDAAADVAAYDSGGQNNAICRDAAQIQFMRPWDIGIFRGEPNGLLHRTPDRAATEASLLLRLDGPRFWDHVIAPRRHLA